MEIYVLKNTTICDICTHKIELNKIDSNEDNNQTNEDNHTLNTFNKKYIKCKKIIINVNQKISVSLP